MRIRRVVVALVTLASLLMAGGGAAFCTPAAHDLMKCCKPARPCATGMMKAADCCRFVPSPSSQVPAAVETSLSGNPSRDNLKMAFLADPARGVPEMETVSPEASPPPLLFREPPVPLYILNTSLLR
jgi:hypothetical protein